MVAPSIIKRKLENALGSSTERDGQCELFPEMVITLAGKLNFQRKGRCQMVRHGSCVSKADCHFPFDCPQDRLRTPRDDEHVLGDFNRRFPAKTANSALVPTARQQLSRSLSPRLRSGPWRASTGSCSDLLSDPFPEPRGQPSERQTHQQHRSWG